MKDIYKSLDKYPTASLQALGLMLMLFEPNATFSFETREDFISYFRLQNQSNSEKCWAELITLGVVTREIVDGKQIYKTGKKTLFEIPLKPSKSKVIAQYYSEQIQFIHKAFHGKVNLLFKKCTSHIEDRHEKICMDDVVQFFKMFKGLNPPQYIKFFDMAEKTNVYSMKYLMKIAIELKTDKKAVTYSQNLQWDGTNETSMENDFALKVATGEALDRTKYKILLEQNRIDELKKYYDLGRKLLPPKQKPYEGYSWL
jgi:hypothetical protein